MTDTDNQKEGITTAEALFDAFGGVGDDLVTDAHTADVRADKKKNCRALRIWLPAAACFLFVAVGLLTYCIRMDRFGASDGSYPGSVISDGTYFCLVPHDGIYACADGESRRLVSKFFIEQWSVNDYGLYWKSGRSLYVLPHGEKRARRLYFAGLTDCSHIAFVPNADGSVIVTIYDKRDKHLREVRVDGKTGAEIGTVTPTIDYRDMDTCYTRTVFTLGERTVILRLREVSGWGTVGTLYEDGSPLFDGTDVDIYPMRMGDALVFSGRAPYDYENAYTVVLRPDGDDSLIRPDADNGGAWRGGDGDWLFSVSIAQGHVQTLEELDSHVLCTDARTGETYTLTSDVRHEFCDLVYDGANGLLYACEPWNDTTTLWRVVFEDGRPARLVSVDEDILH